MAADDPSSALEEIKARHANSARNRNICASVDDIPPLVAAIEAVLELHRPIHGSGITGCAAGGCTWKWPCPTYRAITAELTGKGEDGNHG